MILSSVIIVLGEVLEFTVLTSLLLAMTYHLKISRRWLILALSAGIAGAITYAIAFDTISQWFDGFGQEVINIIIQTGIYLCLLALNSLVLVTNTFPQFRKYLPWLMIAVVTLAVTREGAEIYLYLSGFLSSGRMMAAVLTGSTLGAGIGLSFGILIYYLFVNISSKVSIYASYTLLLFVAAGMILQAVRLLLQIDWLSAQAIVWNTSQWLDEASVTGRLLYTLIGYEATPSLIEIQTYIVAVFGILITTVLVRFFATRNSPGD